MAPTVAAMTHAHGALGRNVPRREGPAKLCGKACYADDLPLRGVWLGATVRADAPHARLLAIRFDPRFDWRRVVVVTPADIPGENVVPILLRDQPSLADSVIRYHGEPVALIAAPDAETLQQALESVAVETSTLEAVFEIDEALAAKVVLFGSNNLFETIEIKQGDALGQLQSAEAVVEGEYFTEAQEHAYLEPQGMQVERTAAGVTIRGSMQCPYSIVQGVAPLLGLPPDKVRVIACATGGGFGGKEDFPTLLAGHAALLAWKARRPVRMIYERVEDIRYTSKRHPSRIRLRSGWTRDGRLLAIEIDIVLDGGAYSTLSPHVLFRSATHAAGPYQCDHVHITARAVATNHPPRGAFRGFGAPQVHFALESHLDACAARLRLDPIELRRRNAVRPGGTLATGQKLGPEAAAAETLERALAESDFASRREMYEAFNRRAASGEGPERFKRRGIGLALSMHGSGLSGNAERIAQSEVLLRGNADGTISALTSQVEIGQGAQTILAQSAAEGLEVPAEWVAAEEVDTSRSPNSGPTVASRTTAIVGGLLISAGRQFREEVERRCGRALADPKEFRSAVARLAAEGPLQTRESYRPPSEIDWDADNRRGDAFLIHAWGCTVVALEVDTLTGEVKPLDVTAVMEVGKVVHPLFAAGQVEGGVTQALGWALSEKTSWSDGLMQHATMTDYAIPTAVDAPAIRAVFLEHPHRLLPHGAKGLGELPVDGTAPAAASALRQALGLGFQRLPIMPETILSAWEERLP